MLSGPDVNTVVESMQQGEVTTFSAFSLKDQKTGSPRKLEITGITTEREHNFTKMFVNAWFISR